MQPSRSSTKSGEAANARNANEENFALPPSHKALIYNHSSLVYNKNHGLNGLNRYLAAANSFNCYMNLTD